MIPRVSLKDKLLRGGFWAVLGKFAAAISGIAVNMILARLLSPEELGEYFLILSVITFAATVSQVGMTQSVVRLVAESMATNHESRARQVVMVVLSIFSFSLVAVASLLAVNVWEWVSSVVFHSDALAQLVVVAVIWFVVRSSQQLIAEVFRGFYDVRLAMLFGGLLASLISLFFYSIFLIVWKHLPLEQVLWATVASGVISVFLSIWVMRKRLMALPESIENGVGAGDIFAISWPLWVTNIFLFAVLQVGVWMAGFFLEKADVALYGIAANTSSYLMMATMILYAFLPPIIAELYAKGELEKLERTLRGAAFVNTVLVLPVVSVFVLVPEWVLGMLYGDYFEAASQLLVLLSVGVFINVITGIRGYTLMMAGYEKLQMKISMVGGIFNLIFCALGGWEWGATGIAAGMVAGTTLQCMMELAAVRVKLGIWTHATTFEFGAIRTILVKK